MRLDFHKLLTYIVLRVNKTKKIFWILGMHAFLVIVIIVLLELFLGGFLFYRYVFLAERKEPEIVDHSFQFKEGAYQEILDQWDQRDLRLQESLEKEYQSPF